MIVCHTASLVTMMKTVLAPQLLLAFIIVGTFAEATIITVSNGETEGRWGPLELCPSGSKAVGYQTQNEANTPVYDDTAMNTIVLFCNDPLETNITSSPGYIGNWQPVQTCNFGSYMKSFQLRVSPAGNESDNTAVNNIRFMCSNDREINGIGNTAGYWGEYSAECPDGICGIETRVRPDGGIVVDNTALNDVRFTCCTPGEGYNTVSVANGEKKGDWGAVQLCPEGSRAIGYQTQNDLVDVPLYDKTAMNSIRLFCNDTAKTNITSSVGDTGTWELRQNCPSEEGLTAFRLRVQPYDSQSSDNTAANSIQFNCTDGSVLNYNGNVAGTWGEYSGDCNPSGICGLQTRVQPTGTVGDNTALNDVIFICC